MKKEKKKKKKHPLFSIDKKKKKKTPKRKVTSKRSYLELSTFLATSIARYLQFPLAIRFSFTFHMCPVSFFKASPSHDIQKKKN